jgi:hypothetical protein
MNYRKEIPKRDMHDEFGHPEGSRDYRKAFNGMV